MPSDRAPDAPPKLPDRTGGVPPFSPVSEPVAAPPATALPPLRPPWAILLLTLAGAGGYLLLQGVAGLAILLPAALDEIAAGGVRPERLEALVWEHLGLTAWVGILVAAPAGIALFGWLARREGPAGLRRRLGLVWPRRLESLGWLLAVLAFGWLYEWTSVWLDRPPMPPVMEQLFVTAGWLPALLVAVVVLAPAFEELAFRGFCLGGLARLGPVAAVALSSVPFAVIHVQYDPFDVVAVLALGTLFGAARWQSGSTLLCFGLHAFHNALASLQALWIAGEAAP